MSHFREVSLTSTDSQEDMFVPRVHAPDSPLSRSQFRRQLPVKKQRRRYSRNQQSRGESVIKCPQNLCHMKDLDRCPADFMTDNDQAYSGETIIVRRSKRQVQRINYKHLHETGDKAPRDEEEGEQEDETVTE